MARAHQNATIACGERKDMTGRNDVVRPHRSIHSDRNGACAISGTNAGRNALTGFYGHRKRGLHAFAVLARHGRQAKLLTARLCHRKADQAAAMGRHEVDRVRRCHLRWNDKVTFIFDECEPWIDLRHRQEYTSVHFAPLQ